MEIKLSFCRGMFQRHVVSAFFALVFCFECELIGLPCIAQIPVAKQSANDTEDPTVPRYREINRTTLSYLRNGQLDSALSTVEPLGESESLFSLKDVTAVAPACAGLYRSLSQVEYDAQFDLLHKWSISGPSSNTIRHLVSLVPTVAPPSEFARVLGERPRKESFPISSIGQVRGIFSSGWMLVIAARESGRLKRLIIELEPLVNQNVAGADLLLMLARIADERGDVSGVSEKLSERISKLKGTKLAAGDVVRVDPADILLAVAALERPVLRPLGNELIDTLLANTNGQPATLGRSFLRFASASANLMNQSDPAKSTVSSKLTTPFKYWVPVSADISGHSSLGFQEAYWLVHEDQILHLSGSPNDKLMLRYPLTGDFQFQCETQIGGRVETDGGLAFGGLDYTISGNRGEVRVSDSSGSILSKRHCPFAHQQGLLPFGRLSIDSTSVSTTVAVRRHPVWIDQIGAQSCPWLGLTSNGEAQPLFRNLRFTGNPVIPRSVRLSDQLRGWNSYDFGNHQNSAANTDVNWTVADGVIQAPQQPPANSSNSPIQSLLSYHRPLLAGESISCEFYYESGQCEFNPALGRIAFLLQPDGVRIRWISDADEEWTTLAADNVVVEPLNRRGPRPLPFKNKDWNRFSLNRKEQVLTLTLNETVIYQRAINWEGTHRFGLYRFGNETNIRIRDIVLTGDWPETLPKELLETPTTIVGEPYSPPDRLALHRIFEEDSFVSNVSGIRRRALAMPVAERFQFLSDWVLPGSNHPGFRMAGEFAPTRPSPLALELGADSSESGGKIISPVFDWLDAARELKKLADCRQQVEAMPASGDEFQRRSRSSLLLLLSWEVGDRDKNQAEWETLFNLIAKETPGDAENHWPEMLLASRGAEKFPDDQMCADLISDLVLRRMQQWKLPGIVRWHNHLSSLYGRVMSRRGTAGTATLKTMKEWIPVAASTAASLGKGFPNLEWIRRDNTVEKISGHESDYLFYRLPLSGNFDVEFDIVQPTRSPCEILFGGSYAGPLRGMKRLEVGTFRAKDQSQPIEFELKNVGKLLRCRAEVRDGSRTLSLNGHQVLAEPLPDRFDPWIAIRSTGKFLSAVQDLRITGKPIVLDAVSLSKSRELTGWLDYHEEGRWEFSDQSDADGWIVGRRNAGFNGMYVESLLRYQRPLVENGSIDYEFYFEPNAVESHPALDRLAFILHPSGVREHWITDGRHDRTEVTPDNVSVNSKSQRGPVELPLKSNEWNRLKLTFVGSTVSVELNGQLVYERELESTNQRAFGLFHFVDATEARVRNIVMRGDWPKSLPPISQQELANNLRGWSDPDPSRLKEVFTHDFGKDGMPENLFKIIRHPENTKVVPSLDGIQIVQSADGTTVATEIFLRCTLSGDFDIEANFAQLKMESSKADAGILLLARVDAPRKPVFGMNRLITELGENFATMSGSFAQPDGSRSWQAELRPCESLNGRLRLARRGAKLHYLFADGDSGNFELFQMDTISKLRVVREGIRLTSICNGIGNCSVVWKNLTIRAERMTWFSEPPEPAALLEYLDKDADGRLSPDEYVQSSDRVRMNRRDFILFDSDGDGFLSLNEFTPISNGVESNTRGALRDPVESMLEEVIAKLDQQLDNWNEKPNEEQDLKLFVREISSMSQNIPIPQANVGIDLDHNGRISRSEARRFLEVQMGLRLPGGQLLRKPNGNINNFSLFIHIDGNRNNQLEKSEFLTRANMGEKSEAIFAQTDKDGDGTISIDEWTSTPWTFFDPVWEFRRLDTDFDGYLDTKELVKETPAWKMPGTPQLVASFDADGDGKMSLDEYRFSPHANLILAWQKQEYDTDNDGRLSIQELTVDRPWFQVLRSIYFQRFDRNHDGFLDLTEYTFHTNSIAKRPRAMYVINADGTGLKTIDIGEIRGNSIGSPSVSPDGKQIAFDVLNGSYSVMLMPFEGGKPKQICRGVQPTWSPDSHQLAVTRFDGELGPCIIDLASGKQNFLVEGQGTQWSPDGKTIFFTSGNELKTYDIATKQTKTVLGANETEYRNFSLNASWSPDSRRICILAANAAGDQVLLILDLVPNVKTNARYVAKRIHSDSSWHPTRQRILFCAFCEERNRMQLYEVNPETTDPPKLFIGQPQDLDVIDMTWTPDGKQIVFVAGDL